jgi:hypothetical protein
LYIGNPTTVPWLQTLCTTLLRACKDHLAINNPYHEACLIKVIHVFVCDAVLGLCVGNQLEPGRYNAWIFVKGSLAIVWTIPSKLNLRRTRLEVVYPVLANRLSTTLSQQIIDPYLAL